MYRVVSRYSVVVAVVSAAGAVLVGWPPPAPSTTGLDHPWLHAAMPVVFAMQASVVVRAEPRNPIGPILAVIAAVTGVWAVAEAWAITGYPAASVAFALAVWGWLPAMVVPHTVVLLLFPDGRWPGPRWRIAGVAATAVVVVCVLASAMYPAAFEPMPGPVGNPLHIPLSAQAYSAWLLTPLFGLVYVAVATAVASLVWRWRRAGPVLRRQLAWPVLASFVGLMVAVLPVPLVAPLVPFIVPTAVVAAIRWRGLYGVDRVLSRSLVYVAGSMLLLLLLVGVAALSGSMVGRRGGLVPAVVVTAVLVVAFDPVRRVLQRGVDRLVYGRRGDPAVAVSRLGERLSEMLAPEDVPNAIVEVIAQNLGVSQVAVLVREDGSLRMLAQRGGVPEGAEVLEVPLTGTDGPVGNLLVGPRAPGEPLTRMDRRMVTELALHAGSAVRAALLASEIRRARVALILARDEERRRLRRDLHDGLGSYLAGIGFAVDAVRRRVPAGQSAQLARIGELATAATREVRRILDDLRPGPLEQLGLMEALQELAERATEGLSATITGPRPLPTVPLHVELAAYQIAAEALTNVVRHAAARHCEINVVVTGTRLCLTVVDDGAGLTETTTPGLGLASMRARAQSAGGRLTVAPGPGGGTVVSAELSWEA